MNDIEKISISEEEAIEATIRCLTADYVVACKGCPIDKINKKHKEYCQERCQAAWDIAAKCLAEIKLYKDGKLCLVPEAVYSIQCCELDAYKEIGTVEECREAVEKFDKAEKALNVILSGNYNDECNFCVHNDNPMANCQCIIGDGSWCIHNARWNGKESEE